jgi:hypothetical protein
MYSLILMGEKWQETAIKASKGEIKISPLSKRSIFCRLLDKRLN